MVKPSAFFIAMLLTLLLAAGATWFIANERAKGIIVEKNYRKDVIERKLELDWYKRQ